MNKALICVDVQYDFLPGGPLGVPDGDQVIPVLIGAMEDVDVIVLTRDWHPEDHMSFSTEPTFEDGSWPMHCVQGTTGAEIETRVFNAAINTGKPVLLIHKGAESDTEQYSGFQGVVADVWNYPDRDELLWNDWLNGPVSLGLALHLLGVNHIIIGGLALDYCVYATAKDAVLNGQDTSLRIQATRPVNILTGAKAIVDLAKGGVNILGE